MKKQTKAFFRMNIIRFSCIITISACIMTAAVIANSARMSRGVVAAFADTEGEAENPRALTEAEIALASRFVAAECRDEPFIVKLAVSSVLLNRKLSPRFPDTLVSVIFDGDAFECIKSGSFYDELSAKETESARKALMLAVSGEDPTGGALDYAGRLSEDAGHITPHLSAGSMVFGIAR